MDDDGPDRLYKSFGEMSRAPLGGALVGLPVLLLVMIGAPWWVGFGFLIGLSAVLLVIVVRKRRRP